MLLLKDQHISHDWASESSGSLRQLLNVFLVQPPLGLGGLSSLGPDLLFFYHSLSAQKHSFAQSLPHFQLSLLLLFLFFGLLLFPLRNGRYVVRRSFLDQLGGFFGFLLTLLV